MFEYNIVYIWYHILYNSTIDYSNILFLYHIRLYKFKKNEACLHVALRKVRRIWNVLKTDWASGLSTDGFASVSNSLIYKNCTY